VREDGRRPPRTRSRIRAAVGVHDAVGQRRAHSPPERALDEQVAVEDQPTADRPAQQPRQELRLEIRLGPRPCIADHERCEALRVAGGDGKADRPTPVLDHHGDVAQVEPPHELLDDVRVLGRREPVTGPRSRQSEAGVVDGDAAVAVEQAGDDPAVQERPGRVAVQQEHRRPAPLVDVVHDAARKLGVAVGERVEVARHPGRTNAVWVYVLRHRARWLLARCMTAWMLRGMRKRHRVTLAGQPTRPPCRP
jgi:hypothetical protein